MAFELTAGSCQDGPCPLLAVDRDRGKVLLQGYTPPASPELGSTPVGELRIEMDIEVFDQIVAKHYRELRNA